VGKSEKITNTRRASRTASIADNYVCKLSRYSYLYKANRLGIEEKPQYSAFKRLYHVSPGEGERFYLRLLLYHVTGVTSFGDVRTHSDVVQPTFKAACLARGLLDDDDEWGRCLQDASLYSSPVQLRAMFVTILLFNEVANPKELFENHIDAMAEDFLYKARQMNIEST